jgi:hypothetical protein
MDLQRVSEAAIGRVDLVPRAMVAVSVEDFERRHGLTFDAGIDDLDEYQSLYFRGGSRTLAFIHHRGDAEIGMTLYLEREISRREADRLISEVLKVYDLPQQVISWREDEKNLRI